MDLLFGKGLLQEQLAFHLQFRFELLFPSWRKMDYKNLETAYRPELFLVTAAAVIRFVRVNQILLLLRRYSETEIIELLARSTILNVSSFYTSEG